MSNHFKKFKGSITETELERLYSEEELDLTSSARQAYALGIDVFKNDMSFDKFSHHYYNWRRKKTGEIERARTNGSDPPQGKYLLL